MVDAITSINDPPTEDYDDTTAHHIENSTHDATNESRQKENNAAKKPVSAGAAFTRAFIGTLAFLFKRPIRLFRPVKISTWAGLQAIAEEQGKAVTPSFVRNLIRLEGWKFFPKHVFPPLLANSIIGLTLFSVYTTTERWLFSGLSTSKIRDPIVIPFISGAFAGGAQSMLSFPLDSARLLMLRRQKLLRSTVKKSARAKLLGSSSPFIGWGALLKEALLLKPFKAQFDLYSTASASEKKKYAVQLAREWAKRGWSLIGLSVAKDSIGFGMFFMVFECGRATARRIGYWWDELPQDEPGNKPTNRSRRSNAGLAIQAALILVSGAIAGYIFSLIASPFERIRACIWEGRANWYDKFGKYHYEANFITPEKETRSVKVPKSSKKEGRVRRICRSREVATRDARQFEYLKRREAKRNVSTNETKNRYINPEHIPLLPSAYSLVRNAAHHNDGWVKFLFSRRLVSKQPAMPLKRNIGPTRKMTRRILETQKVKGVNMPTVSSGWRGGLVKVVTFLPPYSIGLLVYAVLSGDLQ